MLPIYKDLPETTQGLVIMSLGIVLLLHTLGIFTALFYWILLLAALAMIAAGFMQADLYRKINDMIKR